ncbi:MAG: Nif3-like dinuclear metal center hexameric protein [Rikenellaceae bacterium]
MVTVKEITAAIEEFAPLNLQSSFDNSGLLVGCDSQEVNGAIIAVDLTESVIDEALERGVDMVICHHPIIFTPLRRFNSVGVVERCVERAIRHNLVIYAAHTNLDSTPGGLSWILAEMFGIEGGRVLSVTNGEAGAGFGVVGELSSPMEFDKFMALVADKLSLKMVRYSEVINPVISRVAVSSGSGASLIEDVYASGCDLYMAADFKYNNFLEAQGRVTIADIGHFESEYCAIDLLYTILSKKMFTFALYKSEQGLNPVNYKTFK